MQTVWTMGNASQITEMFLQPYSTGYLDYGGSAYGNATYDPLVAQFSQTHAKQHHRVLLLAYGRFLRRDNQHRVY